MFRYGLLLAAMLACYVQWTVVDSCNIGNRPVTCENKLVVVWWGPCPQHHTRLAKAFYGRRNKKSCRRGIRLRARRRRCSASRASQKLTNWCNAHRRSDNKCVVRASNSVFGDPCRGTYKYLQSCSYCKRQPRPRPQPLPFCNNGNGPVTCEHKNVVLWWGPCPQHQTRLAKAFYGRRNRGTCSAGIRLGARRNTRCSARQASQKLTNWCNAHRRSDKKCVVQASNSVFGDPCRGTYKYMQSCSYCTRSPRPTGATHSTRCPKGFKLRPGTRFCYRVFTFKYTWPEAVVVCHVAKAELAVPNSAAENRWIRMFANSQGVRGRLWIGLNDYAEEGKWVTMRNKPLTYTNWRRGEPNNARGEHCANMAGNSLTWNDVPCTFKNAIICESHV